MSTAWTDTDRPPWDANVGHLLWESATRLNLRQEAALAGTPLSASGLGLLDRIATSPGISVAEMARQTPKSQQTISGVVNRMEKNGYIERRLRGGRGVGLYLTDAGFRAREEASERETALEEFLKDGLGAANYAQLVTLLEQTRALLTEAKGPEAAPQA